MTVSNMHSEMNPFCWTVDYHHNTKSKWMTVLHHCYCYTIVSPRLLIPAPLLKTFPQDHLSGKCEELLASTEQKGIGDTSMFLVKGQLCDWYRLNKDLCFFFFNTTNNFPVNVASFDLKLELVMSFLPLLFLREITAERWQWGEVGERVADKRKSDFEKDK